MKAIQMSHDYNLRPYILNIGGGFPIRLHDRVPHIKEIANIIKKHIQKWDKKGLGITEFSAEPGRFLIATAGILETKIIGMIYKKHKLWVYLSGGLFSGMFEVINGTIKYPIRSDKKAKLKRAILCGPTCDGLDILYETYVPDPELGDKLYFLHTGGYTHVYASNFNGLNDPIIEIKENL